MSHNEFKQRDKHGSKSEEAIAAIWLILYVTGLLDILAFKQSPKIELAASKAEILAGRPAPAPRLPQVQDSIAISPRAY
jgi:hypothetical protein